jgi:hypothetical protein
VDENDELIDSLAEGKLGYTVKKDFVGMILENLKIAGVQQAHKADRGAAALCSFRGPERLGAAAGP